MAGFSDAFLSDPEHIAEALSRFSEEAAFQISGATVRVGAFEGSPTIIVEGEEGAFLAVADGGGMNEFRARDTLGRSLDAAEEAAG